jgi:hypothetical protein
MHSPVQPFWRRLHMRRKKSRRIGRPKTRLGLPDLDQSKAPSDEWFAAVEITNGKLFRCVCRSGTVWGNDRKTCLARRQDVRQEIGDPEVRSSRSAEVLRQVLSRGRRRIGTNPILVRICVRPNDRALLGVQATISRSRQRPYWHRTHRLNRSIEAGDTPAVSYDASASNVSRNDLI